SKKDRRFEPSQVTAQQDSHRLNKFAIGALELFPSRKSLHSAHTHSATTERPRCDQSVLLSNRHCDARHHTATAPRVTSMTTSPSTRSATPPLSARSQRRDPRPLRRDPRPLRRDPRQNRTFAYAHIHRHAHEPKHPSLPAPPRPGRCPR